MRWGPGSINGGPPPGPDTQGPSWVHALAILLMASPALIVIGLMLLVKGCA